MSEGGEVNRDAAVAVLRGETAVAKPPPLPVEPTGEAEGEGLAGEASSLPEASPDEPLAEGGEGDPPAEEAKPEEPKQTPGWKAYARKAQKLKEAQRSFEETKAQFRAQTEAISARLKVADEYDQLRVLFRDDPTQALERLGASYADITSHVLKAGTPEAKIEQLERQLKERTEREQKAAQLAEQQRAERLFVAMATKAEHYPDLAEFIDTFGETELIQTAYDLAPWLRERLGHNPSDEELAKELDGRAKLYHDRIRSRGGERKSTPSPELDTGPGKRAKPSATRAPKTLTNHHAREAKGIPRRETDEERAQRARQLLAGLKR